MYNSDSMNETKINTKVIAEKYGVSEKEVDRIYHSVFQFIHEKIKQMDVMSAINGEIEQTSFNIPELGKLYFDKETAIKYLKRWKKLE